MKNKLTNKILAIVLLSSLTVWGLPSVSLDNDGYYGFETARPVLRDVHKETKLDLGSSTISNGNSVVNLSLRDADVTQVLRMFADQAGMNIIFADQVSGSVTMDLVNIPLSKAFDLVVKANKLYYDIQDNTLVVSSSYIESSLNDDFSNLTIIPVKYVSAKALALYIDTKLFGFSASSGDDDDDDDDDDDGGKKPGRVRKGVVVVNPALNELMVTASEEDTAVIRRIVEHFDRKPTITTVKVNHMTPLEMATTLCTNFIPSAMQGVSITSSKDSKDGSSGGAAGIPTGFASDSSSSSSSSSGSSSTSGMSIGGTNIACAVSDFFYASITSSSNSNGESSDSSSDDENKEKFYSMPLNGFTISYSPTLGTVQIVGGSESQIEMLKDYIALSDKKPPQAYLELQIVELNELGSKQFENNWQFLSKNFSFNAGDGKFATSSYFPVFFAGKGLINYDASDFDTSTLWYNPSGAAVKYSGSPQLVYSVNYALQNNKGRMLASPKIVITSGQQSVIDLTSEYIDTVDTQILSGTSTLSGAVTKTYNKGSDNGIKVTVTPFISPDGYVTLDMQPQYQSIAQKLYSTADGGDQNLVATLIQHRNLDLKGVRIKDGETLVLGGMIQEEETKSVKKIPFLGDLPVLGMFFRSTSTDKTKRELVIMITPNIIVDTEDAVAENDTL